MSRETSMFQSVSPPPSVLPTPQSSPSSAPSVEDAVEHLLVRPLTDIVVFIRPARFKFGKLDEIFALECIRLALQWRYWAQNAEIVVLAREGLESLVHNINRSVEAKFHVPPTREAIFGHPGAERQELPWRMLVDLDIIIEGNANDFKGRIFQELKIKSQQARSTPGCQLHVIFCCHGDLYNPPQVTIPYGFPGLALACLSHSSKIVNSRDILWKRPSQWMGITDVELYELLSSDNNCGLQLSLRTLNCYAAAFFHPSWNLVAYSNGHEVSLSVPRSGSGHYRGMWHGVLEGAIHAREHGLVPPGTRELSDNGRTWVQPPVHDFGKVFDRDAKLMDRSISSSAEVRSAFVYKHVKGQVHWSVQSFDSSTSPLKFTPSLWVGPESAQFRPLVAASPSYEFSEMSGSLQDTLSLGLGRPTHLATRMAQLRGQLSSELSTSVHDALSAILTSSQSLAPEPPMDHHVPNKRKRVWEEEFTAAMMTTRLDKAEGCKTFGLTGFPHHSTAFAQVFKSASHETDGQMIKCNFEIYKSAEWPDIRRDLSESYRLIGQYQQSTKENEADMFNLKRYDYVVRRAFMVCYLVGLVDGTATDLRSFRMQTRREPVDIEKIRQWVDDGFDEIFFHDHWNVDEGQDEVVEWLHNSNRYVRHLWRSKGFPDLKVDWSRAVAILEKCESVYPL